MSIKKAARGTRGPDISLPPEPRASVDLAAVFVLRDADGARIPPEILEAKAPSAEEVIGGLESVLSHRRILKLLALDTVQPIRHLIGYYRTAYPRANEFLLFDHARALNVGDLDKITALAKKLSAALQTVTYSALRIKEVAADQNSPDTQTVVRAADAIVGALNSCSMLPNALMVLRDIAEPSRMAVLDEIDFRARIEEQARLAILRAFGPAGDRLRFGSANSQGAKMVHWVANKCLGECAPSPATIASRIRRKS